jgi:hypothetical protein
MVISGVVLVISVIVFVRHRERLSFFALRLLVGLLVFRIAYATLLSWLQYITWKGSPLSQYLLPPHQPWNYFLFYSGTHFWLYPALSVLVMLVAFCFFMTLKKVNTGWFEEGEVTLAVLFAFILGWPLGIFLIPLTFLTAAIITLGYFYDKHKRQIPIGAVLVGMTVFLFLFGVFFLHFLHWEALYA